MTAPIISQYTREPQEPRGPVTGYQVAAYFKPVAGQLWERVAESGADLEVMNGYLVQGVDGCTCSGGPPWGHEVHCGFEPVLEINSLPDVLWAIDIAGERTFYPSHLAAFHAFGHTPPGSKLIPPGSRAVTPAPQYGPWRPACNGGGKRPWFVCRTVKNHPRGNPLEYHEDKRGDLIRYTMAGAQRKAFELNAAESAADGVSASNARQSAFYATHDRTEEARGD